MKSRQDTGKRTRVNQTNSNTNSSRNEEIRPKEKVIIIGDSMTKFVDPKKLSKKCQVESRSFPGATVEDMQDFVKPLVKRKPDKVIIHVGTNNLKKDRTKHIKNKIADLVGNIKTQEPTVQIAVSSIVRRADSQRLNDSMSQVSLNAWFWSTVFHTRDLNWTEKMDYFCATSLVMFSLFACLMRFIGLENKVSCFCVGLFLLCLFCGHVYYLGFVKFDYGYNMKFNVTIGIINLSSWLSWCYMRYRQQPYVWKCAVVIVSLFLLLALELGDFPPILWTFDAHSLWHLGTAPFCYFWYSFLVDDARQQLSMKQKKSKSS